MNHSAPMRSRFSRLFSERTILSGSDSDFSELFLLVFQPEGGVLVHQILLE